MIGILSLTFLGLFLGLLLGYAAKVFAVEADSVAVELAEMMPGTNCGQCGLAGCMAAAEALVRGEAPVTVCPGGGSALAQAFAAKLGIALSLDGAVDMGPQVAEVAEEICIGCGKCVKGCATDAIVGAAKQIHNVLREACTGCSSCVEKCPTEALAMKPVPVTVQHWVMPKPLAA